MDRTEDRFGSSGAEQAASLLSMPASARSDLGCVTLGSLYLSGEGSHLRCGRNDVGIWMTHMNAETLERVPAAAATLGTNSRHRAGERTT